MIRLPAPLTRWEPELRLLTRDLALSLGDLVPRIAAALGSLRGTALRGRGDPDGYDGIANRGPIARLLATEWLLAEEIPDEFLRRAAMAEQSFLALARREQRGERTIAALFDTGPSQLGAPRIVQLALLIVLAERARAAGAVLQWGVLQEEGDPFVGLDPASVRAFLTARTPREPSEADVTRWRARLAPHEEAWVVGGTLLAPLWQKAEHVILDDDVDPEARSVRLRRPSGGRSVDMRLELPPEQASVRLLRDPFTEPPVTARAPDRFAGARMVFSSDGRRLLVRLRSGLLLAYPVPNSPRATPGTARRFAPQPGHIVVATDWGRGRWHVVSQAGRQIRISTLGKRGGDTAQSRLCITADCLLAENEHDPPLARLAFERTGRIVFSHPKGPLEVVQTIFRRTRALAIARAGRAIVSVVPRPNGALLLEARDLAEPTRSYEHVLPEGSVPTLKTGFDPRAAHPHFGLLGVRHEGGAWSVFTKAGITRIDEPEGFTCTGLTDGGALVGTAGDPRILVAVGTDGVRQIATSATPILDACVSDASPYVAYVTAAEELLVRDIVQGHVLLRLVGGMS